MKGFCKILAFLIVCASCTSKSKKEDNSLTKDGKKSSAFSEEATTETSSASQSAKYVADDTLRLKLTPFIPRYPELGESGKRLLASRLNQAVSNYSYGGEGGNPRFIIGPDINLLSKNVTATSPTKYANTYEVNLLSIDVERKTTFGSYSVRVKGIGNSPSKAFINAFKNHTFETKEFFNFLKNTEAKIRRFYENNCDNIIKKAESEAKMREYDKAYSILDGVPMEASCFDKVINRKEQFFEQYLNQQCETLLSKMKAELGKANDPTAAGFNEKAMSYYALIDADADCKDEADKIYQDYKSNLKPEVRRDWIQKQKEFEAKIAANKRRDERKAKKITAKYKHEQRMQELKTEAEIKGNKKLIEKYKYDQLPWLRKVFHLGKNDPFDNIND
jgi:hypothetical protein